MKQRILTLVLFCAMAFAGSACSDDDKSPAKTYQIGEFYSMDGVQGVVFNVSADGLHGSIVSLDENSSLQWATDAAASQKTGAISTVDGKVNQAVVEAIVGWQTKFPAFAWCGAKNKAGVSGWYLPAHDELVSLQKAYAANEAAFNKVLTDHGGVVFNTTQESGYYWSSSENLVSSRVNQAGVFYFIADAYGALMEKNLTARVRAIRGF